MGDFISYQRFFSRDNEACHTKCNRKSLFAALLSGSGAPALCLTFPPCPGAWTSSSITICQHNDFPVSPFSSLRLSREKPRKHLNYEPQGGDNNRYSRQCGEGFGRHLTSILITRRLAPGNPPGRMALAHAAADNGYTFRVSRKQVFNHQLD